MKKIFVGNLDFGVAEESIRGPFEKFGAIERVDLVRDRDAGQPRVAKAAAGSSGGFRHQGGGPPRQRREPRW